MPSRWDKGILTTVELVQSCLNARKSIFSSLLGPAKHGEACLSARKDGESSFLPLWKSCEARANLFKRQERSRKLVHAYLSAQRGPTKLMQTCLCQQ